MRSIRKEERIYLDGRVNDDTISRSPVCRGSDLVLVTELKGVDHSQDFVELTTGRSGVGQSQTDLLCWVDNVNGSDSEWNTVISEEEDSSAI